MLIQQDGLQCSGSWCNYRDGADSELQVKAHKLQFAWFDDIWILSIQNLNSSSALKYFICFFYCSVYQLFLFISTIKLLLLSCVSFSDHAMHICLMNLLTPSSKFLWLCPGAGGDAKKRLENEIKVRKTSFTYFITAIFTHFSTSISKGGV